MSKHEQHLVGYSECVQGERDHGYPGVLRLAKIVHAADVATNIDSSPNSRKLEAGICLGVRILQSAQVG